MTTDSYSIHALQIFTLLFIMLGPLRLTTPFALVAGSLERKAKLNLALKVGLISTITLVVGGYIGSKLLINWQIDPAVLLLGAGILFFLVALRPILYQKETPVMKPTQTPSPEDIALKMAISPYGMAAVIVLISLSQDLKRFLIITTCLIVVMALNVIAMTFTKSDGSKKSILGKILGAVLSTLQLALALQIIVDSLKKLEII